MKSLQISYQTQDGDVMTVMYDSIEEFVHIIDDYYPSTPMLDGVNVIASFHGPEKFVKTFDTVNDLLKYCKQIMRNKRPISEELQKVLNEIDEKERIRSKYEYLSEKIYRDKEKYS